MKNKLLKDETLLNLFHEQDYLEGELSDIERQIDKKANELKIQIGYEICDDANNPYNVCIYREDDIDKDNCLFCHQPDERK